jgi:SEC-C motif
VTLGLVGGNSSYTVVLADRRLTSEGRVEDDEFPKALVFSSPSARLGVTFTGLAKAPGFLMFFVLPELLGEAAKDGPDPEDVIRGFARRLDTAFASLPASVSEAAKQSAVLFAGYKYTPEGRPQIFLRTVSNHRRGATNTHPFRMENIEGSERYNYVSAVGAWTALPEPGRTELGELINAGKPARAVVDKAVEVIRAAARSDAAQNTIGEQLLSVVIPASRSQRPVTAYHTKTLSDTYFFPGSVTVDASGRGVVVMGGSITSGALTEAQVRDHYRRGLRGLPRDTTQRFPPIAIPKVKRNDPCSCGSGQKYKRCHGR